jgi:hypothetical protein
MADLKMARLPDRTPIKLTISIFPDLHQRLSEYATLYADAYGSQEPVSELIPAMLSAFLDSDREFTRTQIAIVR